MEVEKERGERRKVRKRTKAAGGTSSSSTAAGGPAGRSGDVEMSDATTTATAAATATGSKDAEMTTKEDKGKGPVLGGDLEDESIYRAKEAAEFEALVDSGLKNDLGCSTTGLYELVGLYLFLLYLLRLLLRALLIGPNGLFLNADFSKFVTLAIVTHKGAAADSGHYIGFVKKSVFYDAKAKAKGSNTDFTRKLNTVLESGNTPLSESLESGTTLSDPMLRSVANSVLNNALDPAAVAPSELASGIRIQEHGPTDLNSAPVPGPSTSSTVSYDSEDDEDWYKFDDDKVTDFPKEKLSTLEGGGEDSSAYVLVYRSKVL